MILSPSLLSADATRLGEELSNLEKANLSWVHFDIMDGSFVPNITFGQHLVSALRPKSKLFFDVHLMIERPEAHIEAFAKAGANMLVIHAEACRHLDRYLSQIRQLGMQAGLALNPATDLSVVNYLLDKLDMILLMSVNPGFGGQSFIPSTFTKIKKLKALLNENSSQSLIQVDGGVDLTNAKALVECGADVLVSGSAFFRNSNYEESLEAFQNAVN